MPAQARPIDLPHARTLGRTELGRVGAWLFPAALIAYLGLSNGGYDAIPREQVGVAVWWIALVGTSLGLLAPLRAGRPAVGLLALLLAYAAWTAASLAWTDSAERSTEELARVMTYAGFLVVAMGAAAAGHGRQLATGAFSGAVAVVAIAVLSRVHPTWFPENTAGAYLPGIDIESRLAYPLNYASALGALAAMCVPLALWVAADARTAAGRALAGASVPLLGLCVYLTTSAGALGVAAAAVLTYLALTNDRLPQLLTAAAGLLGTLILAAGVDQRPDLDKGLRTQAALEQGDQLFALILLVCGGAGLLQAALALATMHGRRPGALVIARARARTATLIAVLVAIPLALALGAPAALESRWDAFTSREGAASPVTSSRSDQILSMSGSGRYQFWLSATEAARERPWTGTGAGTFEFWWGQNPRYEAFVRDSHSLYFDSLAELGWPGLLLILAFTGAAIGLALAAVARGPAHRRPLAAAAVAVAVAFGLAAGLDWQWEIAVIPAVFLTVLAGCLGTRAATQRRLMTAGLALLAVVAIAIIVVPLATQISVQSSERAVGDAQLQAGLVAAVRAEEAAPFAATPTLQRALILERAGQLGAAATAAEQAVRKEPVNWRPWLILARIRAADGDAAGAVAAFERSRRLNPKTSLEPR